MARRTRSRVLAATPTWAFSTQLTVPVDVPASRATSRMVGRRVKPGSGQGGAGGKDIVGHLIEAVGVDKA